MARTILDEVLDALPLDEGIPPREVQRRIGRWSVTTVRHALRELCREGRARFDGPDCQRLYSKAPRIPAT